MRPKTILCLALGLVVILAIVPPIAAEPGQPSVLRVVIIPSRTAIRIRESFSLALRVENPTKSDQTVRVMFCSWTDEWQPDNPKIPWGGVPCTRNFPVNVEIPPGGAYTNVAQILIEDPVPDQELSFRMGFTPIGSKTTFWSNEVKLHLLPPNK